MHFIHRDIYLHGHTNTIQPELISIVTILLGASVTKNARGTNTKEPKKQPACSSSEAVEVQANKYFSKKTAVTSMKKVC